LSTRDVKTPPRRRGFEKLFHQKNRSSAAGHKFLPDIAALLADNGKHVAEVALRNINVEPYGVFITAIAHEFNHNITSA